MKEEDAYTVDLTKKAKAVNEAVRKPVFKHKSKQDMIQAEPLEPVKDERESEDKQPTEAVACEEKTPATEGASRSRFPLNNMEADLMGQGASAVRAAMSRGEISKFRGRALLRDLPADATEGIEIPKSTDKGRPFKIHSPRGITDPATMYDRNDADKATAYEGIIDTEIGDEYNVPIKYSSTVPCRGSVEGLTLSFAKTIKSAMEDIGGLTADIQPARAGGYAVIFSQEEEEVPTTKWYALITSKEDDSKILQVTVNSSASASENDIRAYVESQYGKEHVLQVSKEKLQ